MGSSADEQQFCLRWNNFQANITSQFETLRDDEDFTDVTIACEGQRLQAHKVVLSACSPYFKELFKTNPCSHPIIFMRDVEARHVVALMEFMYAGEVNVAQANLSAFLKTAESLKIRGLTDTPSEYQKEKGTIFLNPQLSSVNPSPPVLNNARGRKSAPSGVTASPTACSSTVTSSQDNTTNGEENSNSAPATTTTTSTTKSNSQVTEVGNHGRTRTETPPSKRLCKQLIEEELILDHVHSKTELIDENDEEEDVDEEVGAVVDLQAELDDVMHRAAHAYEGCSDGEKESMLRDEIEPKVELPDYLSDDERDEGVEYFTGGGGLDMKSFAGGMEIHPQQSSNLNSKLNPSQEPIRQRRRRTSEQWFPYDMRCANNGATSPDILTRLQDCEDKPNRLVKLGEGIEIYEDQLRSVKWSDYRKLTRGLATILFSPAELATCSVTGQRWSRAGTGERPVKPALDRAKVQAIISYVATRFPMVEISRIKQVLAYKCKENSTAFKMKAVRYYGDQIRDPEQT